MLIGINYRGKVLHILIQDIVKLAILQKWDDERIVREINSRLEEVTIGGETE